MFRNQLGHGFVWLVGLRDALLTSLLVLKLGPQAELNPIAAAAMQVGGVAAAAALKVAMLLLFSGCVIRIGRASERCARGALAGGVAASAALMFWWDWAVFGG